jgi:hypothetical protein
VTATMMKRAMAKATRLASNKESNGNGQQEYQGSHSSGRLIRWGAIQQTNNNQPLMGTGIAGSNLQ